MLPGFFDHQADVRDLTTYAIINGVRRDIESVTLDRELDNDLPKSIAGGTGLSGGSGTIVWVAPDEVPTRDTSPWQASNQWPPNPGDRVKIYVSDHTTSWPRFTGVIDRTRGTVGGAMVSDIIDFRDRLNVPFTRAALLSSLPPVDSGDQNLIIELRHFSIITLALRQAGFFSTPPAGNNAYLSVPLQGTTFAHIGTVTASHGAQDNTFPMFYPSPWGYSVGVASARYAPANLSGNTSATTPVQVGFLVDVTHTEDAHIRLVYGQDRRIRLRIWPSRRVSVFWDSTLVADLTAAQMIDATRVMLLIRGNTWTLRTNTGQEASGTHTRSGSQALTEIQVDTNPGSRLAGLTVIRPDAGEDFREQYFAPDATFDASSLVGRMTMSPRFENDNLATVVDTICHATMTAGWFDETGILRFVATDRLHSQSPVQTVTTLDDILGAQWETSLLHTRSAVHVEWQSASVSRSRQQRIELYRGSASTMSSGDNVEVFATPGNDEEWFGVDRHPTRLTDANWGTYSTGVGSMMGVHYTDEDGELPTSTATTTITTEPLGTVALKVVHTAGSYPSGVEATLAVTEENPWMRESHRGANLPVIRGYGKGIWVDEMYVSPITGEETTPAMVHDFGCWGGQPSAQRVGDFIAQRVVKVNPTIEALTVTYDPRRQLGDTIRLELGILDVALSALIVGIHETHAHGDHQQDLTVRIIDATSNRDVTYHELQDAWRGGDYGALHAVWINLTNQQFHDDPLRFAPRPRPAPWSPPTGPKYLDINRLWGTQDYEQMRSDLASDTYNSFPRELLEGDSI